MSSISVNEILDKAGTGGPSLPNGVNGGLTLTGDLTLDNNGIYLGGTGSANYLDDYEEGTWTVGLTDGTTTNTGDSFTGGHYVKIGDLVFVTGHIFSAVSGLSGTVSITTLPFPVKSSSTFITRGAGSVGRLDNLNRANDGQSIYISFEPSSTTLDLRIDDTTNENTLLDASQLDLDFRLYFSATYRTDS